MQTDSTNTTNHTPIDVEAELRRLDARGTVLDFDDEDKAEAKGATQFAVGVFVTAQISGLFLVGKELPLWFIVMGMFIDYLYFKIMMSNPGYLPKLNTPSSTLTTEISEICSKMSPEYKKRLFCKFCRVTKPPRSKHCHKCGFCVAKFDHHCFWIGNCVGACNHRFFLIFLAFLSVWMSLSVFYLFIQMHTKSYSPSMVILFIVTLGMLIFILPLFVGHCLSAIFNVTTCEFLKPTRLPYLPQGGVSNPYYISVKSNLKRFFFVTDILPSEDWEPVME